jgi:hypothetical protein
LPWEAPVAAPQPPCWSLARDFHVEWDTLSANQLWPFSDRKFAGMDMVVRLLPMEASCRLLCVQVKCSYPETARPSADYIKSLNKSLQARPNWKTLFEDGQVCFLVMLFRDSVPLEDEAKGSGTEGPNSPFLHDFDRIVDTLVHFRGALHGQSKPRAWAAAE